MLINKSMATITTTTTNYDLSYMKSILTSPDICYEVLEEVKLISLDSQFAKWEHLINTQDSVVGIALNVLPEIKYEVEQAIIEVIKKKAEARQQGQPQQQATATATAAKSDNIIVDIIEFMSLCEFYSNASIPLQDLLMQFQKQFLPFHQESVEKMFKMANISRPITTVNENATKTPATATGKRRR